MIFAIVAVILVWGLIAYDLWVLSHSTVHGKNFIDVHGAGIDLPARLLVILLGVFLFGLVWQAWRAL